MKADSNQSWVQDLKHPVLCSWNPNKTVQMEKLEEKMSAWLGNPGAQRGRNRS